MKQTQVRIKVEYKVNQYEQYYSVLFQMFKVFQYELGCAKGGRFNP